MELMSIMEMIKKRKWKFPINIKSPLKPSMRFEKILGTTYHHGKWHGLVESKGRGFFNPRKYFTLFDLDNKRYLFR